MSNIYTEPAQAAQTSVTAGSVFNNEKQPSSAETENETQAPTQSIEPNALILAEALSDKTIGWKIHNCKITKKTVTQDLPLPFLYHYDSLNDAIKQANPLTPALLSQFNTPMSAHEAAKLIGINEALITSPWHVKIVGSLVVFSEALQLAVRLHWTNTGKDTQQLYTQNEADAITAAFKDWQFFWSYRCTLQKANLNQYRTSRQATLRIEANADYQCLPATHALVVIAKLEADKIELPWFEAAIVERVE
ncbi:LOW QUALITY PROTEIN: hypothetical protein JCM18902_1732 [Psychrobacter sp. JCM 18902]|nr:LOW QUALITY PROTEIN: hypothetical protein JCM18902_1732 [Psychrobacter sp. JCM 18902]